MSKLSFRARALDAFKPMPIYMAEELPDLPLINRAVPQMPSGMHKEEECEHHLQRAICAGLIIPTPEVSDMTDLEIYNRIYPADYKLPRQMIHVQPLSMEQDIPDYDMDSEDEKWVKVQQSKKVDLEPLQFEEMMDRLEKGSGQNVVTLQDAKALLKEDDDLIVAVFDYWLNKRLNTQHPLLLTVKTDNRQGSTTNNPYLAFRRRMEKMQTRKNRKNDEFSFEKMLKLGRDLSRANTIFDMVKRREKMKREHLHLTTEIYEKRDQAKDFNGKIMAEVSAVKASRPAFAPLFANQFGVHQNWTNKIYGKDEVLQRKEKRQYKKRKHKSESRSGLNDLGGMRSNAMGFSGSRGNRNVLGRGLDLLASSDEEFSSSHSSHKKQSLHRDDNVAESSTSTSTSTADEGLYPFRRTRNGVYLPPATAGFGNWPWCSTSEGGVADKRFRFAPTSVATPEKKCIGLARRRVGRGGRVLLDRYCNIDEIWSDMDFKIQHGTNDHTETSTAADSNDWLHFQPKSPPATKKASPVSGSDSDVEAPKRSPVPYPFPPETISICVDMEDHSREDAAPFTAEFNVADYFAVDTLPGLELSLGDAIANPESRVSGLSSEDGSASSRTNSETTFFGNSRFTLMSNESLAQQQIRSQCSVDNSSGDKVNNADCYYYSPSLSFIASPPLTLSSSSSLSSLPATTTTTTAITQCTSSVVETRSNHQVRTHHRQIAKNSSNSNNGSASSVLSKSLSSPTNNRGGNFANCHQNGPKMSNNVHGVNNSGTPTILLPQKHPPSNLLPSLRATNKLANLRQQQQNQGQQIPTSGEITLNSSSEKLDMEVDGDEESQQQQQLVRTSKTNSLAMEVT